MPKIPDRVGVHLNTLTMQNSANKAVLVAAILASKTVGGTHCSNCGHCKATL